ncbi:dephospho-CoA kinase [Catenovulum sp. 2E275]|uniref:dephospho-CoA kinase n=1 Tax=Catenovulum sp. 2E275 TaxID=2980497 RepID=UPI0021CFFC35|nr:dephospho-CoA kinase [Catenovulum sp. 2E275]MCU4674352.1 dephospho-CoA kinase [Catenovulum sp. 2E275]
MSQFIVGLTGGIGSGKTTVANMFAELGVEIIDADIIARDVVKPNTPALNKIAQQFGKSVLLANGELNRAELRTIIFADEQAKSWLNALLHPVIRNEMITQSKAAQSDYCILAVPLLLENNLTSLVNRILITDCKPETQVFRACHRDKNSAEQIKRIMAAQLDRESRINYADDIIDTELSIEQVAQKCKKLHQLYLNLASNRQKIS